MKLTQLLVAGAMALVASSASAAPLISGLGGPAGYGNDTLAPNDDGSTGEIDVRAAFPSGLRYFGSSFNSIWVNNNGNITFGGPAGEYTPRPFPVSNLRMIAPWWGDVDTRGGGMPARNGVYWHLSRGRLIVTWHNVGYYASHDDLSNDFQLVLTAAGSAVGDFDVEFRYNTCRWTTGDASGGTGGFGGTPAQAGFDAGNLRDYIALPGSITMAVLGLCTTSNVGEAGVWRFTIRDGAVMCPGMGTPCTTDRPGVCAPGVVTCVGTGSTCVPTTAPSTEVCNGLDDDCNGTADDGIATRTCYTGPGDTQNHGVCHGGTQSCGGGAYGLCLGQTLPTAEVCNGLDDDCNGVNDDVPGSVVCGVGLCRTVVPNCANGGMPECVPGTPERETCNGADDDCDGVVDNGVCGRDGGPARNVPNPTDASTDAPQNPEASTCHDYRCNPDLWLSGKAGPLGGCGCRAAQSAPSKTPLAWGVGLALVGLRSRRRARRR